MSLRPNSWRRQFYAQVSHPLFKKPQLVISDEKGLLYQNGCYMISLPRLVARRRCHKTWQTCVRLHTANVPVVELFFKKVKYKSVTNILVQYIILLQYYACTHFYVLATCNRK